MMNCVSILEDSSRSISSFSHRFAMKTVFRFSAFLMLLATLLLLPASLAFAQNDLEEEDFGPRLPFAVVTVRNIDQSLSNIGKMFEVSGREDMMEMIEGFLNDKAGNLDGIDRTKPFGVMFFLSDSLPPQPFPMAYIPVGDIDAFVKTASLGPAKPEKIEGKEGSYKFPFGGRRNRGLNMVIRDGYAFVTPNETILEDELPDPEKLVGGMASRYDVSVSALLMNIPPLLKDFFVATLQASSQAELQQRDEESEAAHKMRKASGQSVLELMSQVLRDGEQLTFGLEAKPEEKTAALELMIDAKPESEFSKFMKNIGGRKSVFEPLESDHNPLAVSVSWKMDRREKEMVIGMLDGLEIALTEQLPETTATAISRIADSLRATAEQEHVNGIFQFAPIDRNEFALIGALKLVGSQTFGTALHELLTAVGDLDGIDSVELGVHQHQNVIFHRLVGKDASEEDMRIYGGHPSVYLGSGNGIFWFGLGGDAVLSELDFAIDLMLETPPGTLKGSTAPLQVVFRMLPWLDLPERENGNPDGRELAQEAMDSGNDAVRIDIRPTETGGRVRVQFEEGFVRLLGLILARQYDESQL